MKIARTLFVLLAATLASCSDSPTEPTVGTSGSLSFSYTGAGAANATQYSATGAIPANFGINNGSSPWAAGGGDGSATFVLSAVPQGSNKWDVTQISIARTTIGTSGIDVSCDTNTCTDITVIFASSQNGTNYTYFCTLTSGTVNISAISTSNVTGTFSGNGTCHAATGGDTPFAVTGGTFNVGVTTLVG